MWPNVTKHREFSPRSSLEIDKSVNFFNSSERTKKIEKGIHPENMLVDLTWHTFIFFSCETKRAIVAELTLSS